MKKNKKIIIGWIVLLIIVGAAVLGIVILNKNDNRLNVIEKQWINENNKIIVNIGVKNDANVFGNDGSGVFYDFITDFSNEYSLTLNPTTYTKSKSGEEVYFRVVNELSKKDLVLYQDHYVLISKNNSSFSNFQDLQSLKIGILSSDATLINNYIKDINNISFTEYSKKEQLLNEFDKQEDINYILVPLVEYLDIALKKDNYINFHVSDIPIYYTLYTGGNDKNYNSILRKYYNNWIETNFNNHYANELFTFFIDNLDISQEQVDKLKSKTYDYGFIENSPYETLSGSNYGGIIGTYLEDFKNFSKIDIKYTRYKNKNNLIRAINKKDVDLYFNYYNINSDFETLKTLINAKYDIVLPIENSQVINSLMSLKDEEVYVLENSLIANYLESSNFLKIKTYKDNKDLKRLVRKKKIIAVDNNNYLANKDIFKNYNSRYSNTIDIAYNFNSNNTETFNKLFQKFIEVEDPNLIINKGINSNKIIVQSGTLLGKIATYILYIIFAGIIIALIAYRSTKKIKIAKRIKKEDKMRFIDQLTSLKNRNYLSENIEAWNKNTIYPQTTLIIDLNNIQYINDTYGYEEGDKQIKAAANILVKLQIDNTDIIRTDGTEFLVYFVGHSEKQIASFMRKLNKEFKKLPYNFGVVMGYSTIKDDLKLIEDAINEATLSVKEKKNEKEAEENGEKI